MDPRAALALARGLLAEHGLDDWRVGLDRAKTRAGACRFARREITLSAPLTRLHSEAEVRDTILHEVAHALVGPSHGHDDVWRATALRIGCSGQRCVPADAPRVEGPWRGTCPRGHVRLGAGDELIASGPDEGQAKLAELCGYRVLEDDDTGEIELVPSAS